MTTLCSIPCVLRLPSVADVAAPKKSHSDNPLFGEVFSGELKGRDLNLRTVSNTRLKEEEDF